MIHFWMHENVWRLSSIGEADWIEIQNISGAHSWTIAVCNIRVKMETKRDKKNY